MRDIGKNVRAARTAKNLTQDELAERLHTTRQTVSNYETGRSRPDVEMLMQIADALGVEVTELLYGVEVPPDRKRELRKFWISAAVFGGLTLAISLLLPVLREEAQRTFRGILGIFTLSYFMHYLMFGIGWSTVQGAELFLGAKPIRAAWKRWARVGVLAAAALFLLPMTLIWLAAVLGKFGVEVTWPGYSAWPVWMKKAFLAGYSFIEAEWRWVMFALGAAFRMTKKD